MRLIFPHGLGDVVQALPSFRRLAEKRGEQLDVGVLERLPACREVLEGAPFVASVFGVRDPWNDFEPANTWDGYRAGMESLRREHGAELVWTHRPADPLSPAWCKAYRIASELGVEWQPEAPDLSHVKARADFKDRSHVLSQSEFVLVHGDSGNPAKDVDVEALRRVSPYRSAALPVESRSLAWNLGLLASRPFFVGIDSGPAHLASVVTPRGVTWVFRATPIQQAIPLWRDVRVLVVGDRTEEIVQSWDAWRLANGSMLRHRVEVLKGVLRAEARSA